MTELVHQLVGYDPKTEMVAYEHDFHPEEWKEVRQFLRADPDDPAMVDVYPIDYSMARDIAGIIQDSAPKELDYFVECSARD